jgi:hypothetical protein
MKYGHSIRVRPSIDSLEHRESPASLAVTPFDWLDKPPHFLIAAQGPHTSSGAAQTRPFHAKDAGTAALNGPIAVGTTITASASGHATHLGAFTLHDTSTIVAIEILVALAAIAGLGIRGHWQSCYGFPACLANSFIRT